MDFELSEEQIAARDLARDFAAKEIAPTAAADDRAHKFRPDLIRKMGALGFYGAATWEGFRQPTGGLGLSRLLEIAREAGGADHHFRFIQLPFNLAMTEALTSNTQAMQGGQVPVLQMAQALGLMVFASASLLQGQLASGIPLEIQRHFSGLDTDAQRAIQFARSAPGITGALVGMGRVEHVEENMGTARVQPLAFQQFRALFGSSTGTEGGRQ